MVWSLWKYFERFRDVEFIRPLYRRLITKTARFYGGAPRCPKQAAFTLLRSLGGALRRSSFTVSSVIGGLESAAKFAAAFGEVEQQQCYFAAAQEIRTAMLSTMWSDEHDRFCRMATRKGSGYELDMTVDASMYGVFAFGALDVHDPRVASTMKAVKETLWVKTKIGGVARYTKDYYQQVSDDIANVPGNPWFICTMWLAQYQIAVAQNEEDLKEAMRLLLWVADRALPSGIIAEQVDPYTGAPLSVSPLTWSHASFIMCVMEYLEKRAILAM